MNKIINFHDVNSSEWFEKVIIILRNKYNLISIKELESFYYEGRKLNNSCHITVDDGHKSFYEVIYPVLKKFNIPATIFVSPEICIEEKNFWFQEIQNFNLKDFEKSVADYLQLDLNILSNYPAKLILKNLKIEDILNLIKLFKEQNKLLDYPSVNMNIKQLIQIDKEGLVTIGAHTNTHPILANETFEKSKSEIVRSFEGLSNILNHEISYFAFPNGLPELDFGKNEIEALKSINCKLAFTTQKRNITKNDNPLSIPRFGFSYGNQYFIYAKLLFGKYWEVAKVLRGIDEKEIRSKLKRNKIFQYQ